MNGINSSYEKQVQVWAAAFDYPPTPDIARKIQPLLTISPPKPRQISGRLAWALVALLLAASLLAVPAVRAAVVEILRAGGITIFVGEEAAVDDVPPLLNEQLPSFTEPITLDEALAQYPNLQLPTELPPPDDLLLHEVNAWESAVIFLWRDEDQPDQIALSLYQINAPQYAAKGAEQLEQTEVNNNQAFWVRGPHIFRLQNAGFEEWRFVAGNVLIWWDGAVTYRLEGADSLEDALRLAESLQDVKQ